MHAVSLVQDLVVVISQRASRFQSSGQSLGDVELAFVPAFPENARTFTREDGHEKNILVCGGASRLQ